MRLYPGLVSRGEDARRGSEALKTKINTMWICPPQPDDPFVDSG